MTVRPTDLPLWATDANATVEPSAGQKQAGWLPDNKAPAKWMNWWMHNVYSWMNHLKDLVVSNWHTETLDTLANYPIYGIAIEDNDESVIVGANGFIAHNYFNTPEGHRTWRRAESGTTEDLYAVYQYSGTYCAVGANGTILTSTNGWDWTARTPAGGFSDNFYGVTHDDGTGPTWVIVGEAGEIQTSSDGTTWTARTAAGGYSDNFRAVAYHNSLNLFCAVGENGEIQTSPGGTTWTARTAAGGYTGTFYGVTHDTTNALFIAVGEDGEIQTSDDGIDWDARTAAGFYEGTFRAVHWGLAHRPGVIVGEYGEIQVSEDGVSWERWAAADGFNGTFYAVHNYNSDGTGTNGLCLVGGEDHALQLAGGRQDSIGSILTLGDFGSVVPVQLSGTYEVIRGLAYDETNGVWVAACYNGYLYSSNNQGRDWTLRASVGLGTEFRSVAWGNDLFVAVGGNHIYTSPDGTTWTERTPAGGYAGVFRGVSYVGNSLWVVVGSSGEIQTSSDGTTWTARTPAGGFSDNFYGVAGCYIDTSHYIVAVGENGEIQTSSDGTTWTARTADGGYAGTFYDVTTNESDMFVAVGSSGEIQTAPLIADSWTARTADGGFASSLRSVSSDRSGHYVTVGASGEIQSSSDGETWTKRQYPSVSSGALETLQVVSNDRAGHWLAGGDGWSIISSLRV